MVEIKSLMMLLGGKSILVREIKEARGLMIFKGLMFSKKPDYGLVFAFQTEKIRSLHMFFVFFPIDAVYLDENKKVVDIKRNLRPFSLNYTPKAPSKYLIEIPTHLASAIGIGDQLFWELDVKKRDVQPYFPATRTAAGL